MIYKHFYRKGFSRISEIYFLQDQTLYFYSISFHFIEHNVYTTYFQSVYHSVYYFIHIWWVFCAVGQITVLLKVCRVYPAALAPVWPVCWLWFTVKCNCWVLRRRLFSQVIFHLYLSTQASLEMTLSGCSAADCCAAPGYASLCIFHREKSVSWTRLICLLFSAATLPIHQTLLTVAARQSAVPRRILLSVSPPVI